MRILDEKNIEDIALGAAVLGTGGGVQAAKGFFGGQPFLLMNGDNY